MKNKKFIRSSKTSLKFLNKNKYEQVREIVLEYNKLLNKFIEYYWSQDLEKLPKFCPAEDYKQTSSNILNTSLKQSCGKQALAIVRGAFQKQNNRIFKYNQLIKEKQFKQAAKLKEKINSINITCPTLDKLLPIQLSAQNCTIFLDKPNSFDGWVQLHNSKREKGHLNKQSIMIPFKRTKHFNKRLKTGKLAKSILLSLDEITFCFEYETKYKETGKTLGIDIGISDLYNCSDGQKSAKLNGKDLADIQRELARKMKGSKAFGRKQIERDNYIRWAIKQIVLKDVALVRREDLKDVRKYRRLNRFMQAWTYRDIVNYIDSYCEEQNVFVQTVKPTYTSQRCSQCGWVQKANRKGKLFECRSCGFTTDADFNASCNIALPLVPIGTGVRLAHSNKQGFYWNELGQEFTVPDKPEKQNAIIC